MHFVWIDTKSLSCFFIYLILVLQFCDKLQIAYSAHIHCDPFVNSPVEFRTEMILPIASFTLIVKRHNLNDKLSYFYWTIGVPFLIKWPSGFKRPTLLPPSLLTASFIFNCSKLKCSTSLFNCSSLKDFLRNVATFSISPLRFCRRNSFI